MFLSKIQLVLYSIWKWWYAFENVLWVIPLVKCLWIILVYSLVHLIFQILLQMFFFQQKMLSIQTIGTLKFFLTNISSGCFHWKDSFFNWKISNLPQNNAKSQIFSCEIMHTSVVIYIFENYHNRFLVRFKITVRILINTFYKSSETMYKVISMFSKIIIYILFHNIWYFC